MRNILQKSKQGIGETRVDKWWIRSIIRILTEWTMIVTSKSY